MVSLLVDTVSFVDAGAHAQRSAHAVESALGRASSGLGGLSQMAGSDPNGAKWAAAYDKGAGQIFSYTGQLQDAVAAVARKLAVTGYYYELVEATNAGGNGAGLSFPAPASQSTCLSVASAAGGKRVFPNPNPAFEWIAEQVSNLVGEMWPDGDTGKLDAASKVWHQFADDLDAVSTGLTSVTDALAGISTPELAKIHTSVSQLRSFAKKLASAARQVGSACNELSGKINYVHVQTEITVGVLIAAVAVTAGAALGLTVFTFGISDVAGAGAIAGETGGAVATIMGFIADLTASISTTVGGIVAASAEFVGIGGEVAAGIGTVAGDMTAGAVMWGVAGAGENTIVTGITEPGSNLLDAAGDGFIEWGATGGVFGGAFGAGRLAAGEGMAASVKQIAVPLTSKTIPQSLFDATYAASVHNPGADRIMLGKFVGPGDPASYITQAGSDHAYFSLGDKWDEIKAANGLTDNGMFKLYNERFLQDGVDAHKVFDFSHSPIGDRGALGKELKYLEAHGYKYNAGTMQASPR
jgi:hypothetical protein